MPATVFEEIRAWHPTEKRDGAFQNFENDSNRKRNQSIAVETKLIPSFELCSNERTELTMRG